MEPDDMARDSSDIDLAAKPSSNEVARRGVRRGAAVAPPGEPERFPLVEQLRPAVGAA